MNAIQAILAYFDASMTDGHLLGSGPGKSGDKRAKALRNMIEAAGDLIILDPAGACVQLRDALERTDGEAKPPEFVEGGGAAELAGMIADLRSELICAD